MCNCGSEGWIRAWLALWLLGVGGCLQGEPATPRPPGSGGDIGPVAPDGGRPPDGGRFPDGGPRPDAGAGTDAGASWDAGPGSAPDGAVRWDTGFVPDLSPPADAEPGHRDLDFHDGTASPDGATPIAEVGPPEPVCGNGVREAGEACDEADPGCVGCQIPCDHEGGRACGGNTIPGDPQLLYECRRGRFVILEHCAAGCAYMPPGVPDRCADEEPAPDDPPARLVRALAVVPYVEQDCEPAVDPRWPFAAQRCRYTSMGVRATVVVANPDARRVARWIVDSAELIPALAALAQRDHARYVDGLVAIAEAVLIQSSRIFPLDGEIIEDMEGDGPDIYQFDRGVTEGCSTGCYCRINSLHRTEWCAYRAAQGGDEQACLDRLGRRGLTEAWGQRCLQNHLDAWESDRNEHFRARAHAYQQALRATCPRADSCDPAEVLTALRRVL